MVSEANTLELAVARLAQLDDLPLERHPEILREVKDLLQDKLSRTQD